MARINKYRTGKLREAEFQKIDLATDSNIDPALASSDAWKEMTDNTISPRVSGIPYIPKLEMIIKDGEVLKFVNKNIKKRRR